MEMGVKTSTQSVS